MSGEADLVELLFPDPSTTTGAGDEHIMVGKGALGAWASPGAGTIMTDLLHKSINIHTYLRYLLKLLEVGNFKTPFFFCGRDIQN